MSHQLRIVLRYAVVMVMLFPVPSASAQDSTRAVTPPDSEASWYRDPQTARTLGSFIPGAGHLYAGEKLRGLGLGGAALLGIGSGILYLTLGDCPIVEFSNDGCGSSVSTVNKISGVTEIAVGVAAWVFSAIDAPRAAMRANEKARRRVAITPFIRDDAVRRATLGVAVTVGW